jgi:trans-aconitate methyltransferase
MDFLRSPPDFEDPWLPSAFDETSFWCARFGTLLLDQLELGRGLEVLDLGCGTGFPTIELAQMLGRSSRITGLDTWRERRSSSTAFGTLE